MVSKLVSPISKILTRLAGLFQKIRANRKLRLFINIGLVLVACLFIGRFIVQEWTELQSIQIQIHFIPLLWAILLLGVNNLIFIVAWHIILKGFQSKSTLLEDIFIYSYSQVAKLLPTPTWYLAGRVYFYHRIGMGKKVTLATSLLEAALHAWMGLILFLAIESLNHPLTGWPWLVVVLLVTISLVPAALWVARKKTFRITRNEMIARYAAVMLLFLVTWIISLPFFNFIINGVTENLAMPWVEAWKAWIISSIYAYIGMFTLGGIGVLREFSLVLILTPYFSPPIALGIAVVSRLISMLGSVVWSGVLMLISKGVNRPGIEQNLSESKGS